MFGFESNAPSRTKFFVDRGKGGWGRGEGMEVYRDRFERDRGIKYPGKILDRGLNDS